MTTEHGPTRLAVWGSPIAHSRSPALHAAAYARLGLDWRYGRREVDAASFDARIDDLDASWRGLSLTMPLKTAAFRACAQRDRRAELTGAVNTILLTGPDGPRGVNTDVGGLVRSLREAGVDGIKTGRIVGAGATAASALVALGELGADRVSVIARRPEAAAELLAIGERMGVDVATLPLDGTPAPAADVTIGTLPGGVRLADPVVDAMLEGAGALLDVAYSPWPSQLAEARADGDPPTLSGLAMLLHQAVLQVRFFVTGDVEAVLPDEPDVVAAMRAALVGD